MNHSSDPQILVGIDVGGTFTDVLAYDPETQRMHAAKVPSLPGAQWMGVLDALSALGIESHSIRAFVHGTTIATNALLERKGAVTGLVTTRGFRDVLEVGKARRLVGGLFDMRFQRAEPIVPRHLRLEVDERVASSGDVLKTAAEGDCEDIAVRFRGAGVRAVAVAFINSHINDENEKVIAERLQKLLPGVFISNSADLLRERGEFERTSTVVLNAYLTPLMVEYLETLTRELNARRVSAPVNIMSSNGGAMTLAAASKRVVGTFLSGPVGGVVGALRVAESCGLRDVITFDMGGTSTDVALIHDLQPRMSYDNQIDAFPLQMPQLDIHAIGAGGGSIVWVGDDGTLQVGPHSAGALPGPACYGRGGTEATVSDANLIVGRLPTTRALSGGLTLRHSLAESAFGRLADKLETSDIVQLAHGVLRIAVAKMASAVREVSVHRGYDPRDYSLIAFGGAGPMHALEVADELGISLVVIPHRPGHLSALGQLLADIRRDWVLVWGGRLRETSIDELHERGAGMIKDAERALIGDGFPCERHVHAFTLDMRYAGQSFTLPIPWDPSQSEWDKVRSEFDARHSETFGHTDIENDVEIVHVRLVSHGIVDKPEIRSDSKVTGSAVIESRRIWFDGWIECPILSREGLAIGHTHRGPAVIEEPGGTSFVPPGWEVSVHSSRTLFCRRY